MIERCYPAGSRSVAARVAAVIRAVAARTDRSVTEVARCAELPLSTTHRLLAELVAARLLQRSPGRRYWIGPAGGPDLGVAGAPIPVTALVVAALALGRRLADDPVALPSGTGPAPLHWPVDPTAPARAVDDFARSTA